MEDNETIDPTPEQIHLVLQQTVLRNYPNPERSECPGTGAGKRLIEQDYPHRAAKYWEYISRCSPCYRELLDIRTIRRSRRRGRTIVARLVAVLIVVAVLTTLFARIHSIVVRLVVLVALAVLTASLAFWMSRNHYPSSWCDPDR